MSITSFVKTFIILEKEYVGNLGATRDDRTCLILELVKQWTQINYLCLFVFVSVVNTMWNRFTVKGKTYASKKAIKNMMNAVLKKMRMHRVTTTEDVPELDLLKKTAAFLHQQLTEGKIKPDKNTAKGTGFTRRVVPPKAKKAVENQKLTIDYLWNSQLSVIVKPDGKSAAMASTSRNENIHGCMNNSVARKTCKNDIIVVGIVEKQIFI